jgi:hypothetical protein
MKFNVVASLDRGQRQILNRVITIASEHQHFPTARGMANGAEMPVKKIENVSDFLHDLIRQLSREDYEHWIGLMRDDEGNVPESTALVADPRQFAKDMAVLRSAQLNQAREALREVQELLRRIKSLQHVANVMTSLSGNDDDD